MKKQAHILFAPFSYPFVLCLTLLLGSCDGEGVTPQSQDLVDAGDGDELLQPSGLSYAIVETGQQQCFDASTQVSCESATYSGQDAQYLGYGFQLVDNADGTISDLVTGLMWQQDPGAKMTRAEAIAGLDSFNLAGYDDWRLPTLKELYSLIDFSGLDPSSPDSTLLVPFIDDGLFAFQYGDESVGDRLIDAQFVSTTLYVSTTMQGAATMFGVNFADGRIKGYPYEAMGNQGAKTFFVLHVRGGDGSYGVNQLQDNGDGSISDLASGLMWQQGDSGQGLNWAEALSYCEDLSLAGHDDWRLPNAKELQSIVDYSRSPDSTQSPALDALFEATAIVNEAQQDDYGYYWSSTTHQNGISGHEGQSAVYVAFGRAMGKMFGSWIDVHGAGAQRSDPKAGEPADYPDGFGPQGDAIRIYNMARCVRLGASQGSETPTPVCGDGRCEGDEATSCSQDCETTSCGNGNCEQGESPQSCPQDCAAVGPGPVACVEQADCEAENACPLDASMGCLCAPAMGASLACIPRCAVDADCPQPPDISLVCDGSGLCVPSF